MTDKIFPQQQYTSIETSELDRLHARIAELEQTAENRFFEHGKKLGEQVLDNRRLLNELDKLRPLEFLLKREGSVTQQMHEKLIELTRKLRDMERGKGSTPDYTREGSAWVPTVKAPTVVVPEPTSDEWRMIAENAGCADMADFLAGAEAYSLWLRRRARTVPADRLLGDGMVAVDREWIEDAVEVAWSACKLIGKQAPIWEEKAKSVIRRDPVRASQGGAAT